MSYSRLLVSSERRDKLQFYQNSMILVLIDIELCDEIEEVCNIKKLRGLGVNHGERE